jgi:hypothetical protein
MNSHKEATIQMQAKQGISDILIIGKSAKQGCPLNPSLFNLGMDPLIRNIRSNRQECGN